MKYFKPKNSPQFFFIFFFTYLYQNVYDMKDFKFLSNNESKYSLSGPMGTNGGDCYNTTSITGSSFTYSDITTTINTSIVKSLTNDNYEPLNDPNVVNHIRNFIFDIFLYGIIISYFVKLLTYAGF